MRPLSRARMDSLMRSPSAAMWGRLVVAWLALAAAMSLNGVFRELVLRPALGARVASVLSAVLGVVLVLVLTRALLSPLGGLGLGTLSAASAAILVLTVSFETSLGLFVDHRSWRALLHHYALWNGELWPIVLAVLTLTPFIWGRWWVVE